MPFRKANSIKDPSTCRETGFLVLLLRPTIPPATVLGAEPEGVIHASSLPSHMSIKQECARRITHDWKGKFFAMTFWATILQWQGYRREDISHVTDRYVDSKRAEPEA